MSGTLVRGGSLYIGSLWQELNIYQEVYVTGTCVRAARDYEFAFLFCMHISVNVVGLR